ncbi:hypothetical protein ACQKOF_11000 [Lysinibacillus sp. NPDC093190]|uniref:hypothetical protein n=1 Tax=Lysinibacillus sp. NPDC093190 TaxID=3390575 RepID=UPI003D06D627
MREEVIEVIISYNDYLAKVPAGNIQIANYLREDKIGNALQMILDFSEGMDWLIQAVELLGQNDVNVKFEAEKIHEFLHEVNTGLEIRDYVLVADMFEYEISPFFEELHPIVGII